jgi:hypothetical protein
MKPETNHAEQQAKAKVETILEMYQEYKTLGETGGDTDHIVDQVMEFPLSVTVRSGWVVSMDQAEPEEFNILLCTGGPAVRLYGELPVDRVEIQYQDWFTPWETYHDTTEEEDAALQWFASQFYFGDE